MDEIPVQKRLWLLSGEVYAAAQLGMWCYGWDGEFFYSTCPHEKELKMFLEISGCLEYALAPKEGFDRPVLLSSPLGLMWIAEHMYEEGHPSLLILMGPFFPSKSSMKSIRDSLWKLHPDLPVRFQMLRILSNVPLLMLSMVYQYAAMLHFCLTQQQISSTEILMQTPETKDAFQAEEESPYQNTMEAERIMQQEALLLQCIQDGNLNFQQMMEGTDKIGGFLSDSGNVLRDGKNSLLVHIALCCRAAIRGGLPARTAKELEAEYFNRAEACTTISELRELQFEMIQDLTQRVHRGNESPQVSTAIRRSCDYIRSNVTREISLADAAKVAGYTEYYFTKKFYQEMGIRVADYIKEAKIDHARILLVSTEKSIQNISDTLNFSNRNYFTRVFREVTGMTPAAYREQRRKDGRDEDPFERKH